MGAISFSLDVRMVEHLKKNLNLSTFVETGTFQGDTVCSLLNHFDRIYTIELSDSLYQLAQLRFQGEAKVSVIHGNSAHELQALHRILEKESVLYWLDAHWCVSANTAGQQSQCPLLEELEALRGLNNQSVVIIDDARLFLAPPCLPHAASQWPDIFSVVNSLQSIGDSHKLMVVNDCILWYPDSIDDTVRAYARKFGVDWLEIAQSWREYPHLVKRIEEKEKTTLHMGGTPQAEAYDMLAKELRALRSDLSELNLLVRMRLGNPLIARVCRKVVRQLYSLAKTRVGVLNQYDPRPFRPLYGQNAADRKRAAARISIVVPSLNQGPFIEKTLCSVLDQEYPNVELIVQDGGSRDGTIEILRKLSDRLSYWDSVPDTGQSDAINKGFVHAKGEIMAYLNSDDLLLPGALTAVATYFEQHPDVDVLYGHRVVLNESSHEIGRWVLPPHSDQILKWVDYVPQETLFWRRGIWEKAGARIDDSFQFAMDWDLLLRFQEAGARMVRLPRFLGAFRVHSNQKTSTRIDDVGNDEMNRLRERANGRKVTQLECRRHARAYQGKSLAYYLLFKLRLLRYEGA